MISFHNMSFTSNLANLHHSPGFQASQLTDLDSKILLRLYYLHDQYPNAPLFKCHLVKTNSSSSQTQLKYEQQYQNQTHRINLESSFQKSPLKFSFQLGSIMEHLPSNSTKITHPQIFYHGFVDFSNSKSDECTVTVLDRDNKFVRGFLSFNYHFLNSENEPANFEDKNLAVYFFGIKIFINGLRHKRAFLTFSQPQQSVDNKNKFLSLTCDKLIGQLSPQNEQQAHFNTKKLQVRHIQKGWIWYRDIVDFSLKTSSSISSPISLNLYSFDFSSCQATYICGYKGSLFIDFAKSEEVKFTEFEMVDELANSEEVLATIQFKYCLENLTNLAKASLMSSNSYLENAFSPAHFVYDNRSFVSNASLVKGGHNKSLDTSHARSARLSQLPNLNKINRNVFVKSKFHSVFASNRGVPMDRQERFPSPKKKLTDQLGYYAHRTLDINQLPTREKYRYSSFGKDTKECLKLGAFSRVGPGAGIYRLPSVFDKY